MSASTQCSAEGFPGAGNAQPEQVRATKRALWLVAGGVLSVWAAHNALLLPWEVRHVEAAVREPTLVLLRAVIWMVPALVYLRRHDARRPLLALGVTSPVNSRGLAKSAIGAAIYLSLIVLLLRATAPPEAAGGAWAALAPLPVLYTVLKAVLEELFMRGFLLRQLARFTSSFRAQASVAVLFMLGPRRSRRRARCGVSNRACGPLARHLGRHRGRCCSATSHRASKIARARCSSPCRRVTKARCASRRIAWRSSSIAEPSRG